MGLVRLGLQIGLVLLGRQILRQIGFVDSVLRLQIERQVEKP